MTVQSLPRDFYNIEMFASSFPTHDPNKMRVEIVGWVFVDGDPLESADLCVAGAMWRLDELSLWSPDVGKHFATSAADHCRFRGAIESAADQNVFVDAIVLVTLRSGTRYRLIAGDRFVAAVVPDKTVWTMMTRLRSLGDNCEVGLLQRRLGLEPLDLFRFASTLLTCQLVHGLSSRLQGFAEKQDLLCHRNGGEWMTHSATYGFAFHSHMPHAQVSETEVRTKEARRLGFLARKFIEDAEGGEFIFVRRIAGGHEPPEECMWDLYRALRSIGPSRLFWVTSCDAEHETVGVTRLDEGLFRGWIRRLGSYSDAHAFETEDWLDLFKSAVAIDGFVNA